jgi:hypothetical protein
MVRIHAPAASRGAFEALLACVFTLDCLYLRGSPDAPSLYSSGVRYHDECPGEESWATIPVVLDWGEGVCKDLACWRAAELVVSGEDPYARPELWQIRPRRWHVVVRRSGGYYEDPSRALGMR